MINLGKKTNDRSSSHMEQQNDHGDISSVQTFSDIVSKQNF